jgi:hypothetical protein
MLRTVSGKHGRVADRPCSTDAPIESHHQDTEMDEFYYDETSMEIIDEIEQAYNSRAPVEESHQESVEDDNTEALGSLLSNLEAAHGKLLEEMP